MSTTQTDVSSIYITGTGALGLGMNAARIKGIYFVAAASAGSIVITQATASGKIILKMDTPAGVTLIGPMVIFPGEGIRCVGDPFVTVTNITSATIFYG